MTFELFEKVELLPKSHGFVLDVYRATSTFPKEEQYGIISQLRRAAVSVPTNIAEGKGRGSDPELMRFLFISRASLQEVRYLLLLSKDLGFLTREDYVRLECLADDVARMISRLLETVKRSLPIKPSSRLSVPKERKAESGKRLKEEY